MRILFYPLNEYGHVLPTFRLAHALAARGHEIVYACALDFRAEVERHGFRCVPVHRDIFPLGRFAEIDRLPPAERELAIMVSWGRLGLDALHGWLEHELREIAPDIALVDVIQFVAPYIVHRVGIPMLRLSTSLSQRFDELPPLTSALRADAPEAELEAARAQAYASRASGPVRNAVDCFAAHGGYPVPEVEWGVFAPFPRRYAEVVLCPSALDFPRPRSEPPTYFAFPPELDRDEHVPETLAQFCADGGPLIYVSLGSQVARYPQGPVVFRALLEVLRARPGWRAVIASGEQLADVFAELPPNVHVIPRAPQIWMLRRASVFVTHAGLGSMREAIALHVPMLAVPQQFDQPGNAARLAWHGLGLIADATPAGLEHHLDRLLADRDRYRERLEAVDAACRAEFAQCTAVELVERTAAPPTLPPRSPSLRVPAPVADEPQLAWLFAAAEPRDGTSSTPPEDGVAGFAACLDIADALEHASGPIVARVEIAGGCHTSNARVIGGSLRCLSSCDVTTTLLDYADWCTELALEPLREEDPANRIAVLDGTHKLRALRVAGASPDELRLARGELAAPLKHLWQHGYEMVLHSHSLPDAHEVARMCRTVMLRQLARRAAGSLAGTPEGAERFARALRATADRSSAELARRIAEKKGTHRGSVGSGSGAREAGA